MKIVWSEISKFLKNNSIKLIIGVLIGAVSFVGLSYFFGQNNIENLRETIEIEGINEEAKPAYFRFYIENQENDIFTNNLLIEEYFNLPDVLEEVSINTNTNVYEIVSETENEAIIPHPNPHFSNVLGVNRDGSSQLLTFYVNVGNERNNLQIAKYYLETIYENDVPFLEDKTVYVFEEPQIQLIDEEDALQETTVVNEETNKLLLNIVIGSIFGIAAVVLILFALTLFSNKLVYSFSYNIFEKDHFFLINNVNESEQEISEIVTSPSNARKIVISERNGVTNNHKFNQLIQSKKDNNNLEFVNSVLEIERPEEVDRFIYLVTEDMTSRDWYNKQRRLGKNLDINTIVLQVNADE